MTSIAPTSDKVGHGEILGRSVAKTLWADKARRGVISRDVFVDTRPTNVLSVDRMDHAPRGEMAKIAGRREARREGNRRFRGWALIRSDSTGRSGRTVTPTPQSDNPYHADIRLPVSADVREEVKQEKRAHGQELADFARWESVLQE